MSRNPEIHPHFFEEDPEKLEPMPTEEEIAEAKLMFKDLLKIPSVTWGKKENQKFVDLLRKYPILLNIFSKECEDIIKNGIRKELRTLNLFDLSSSDLTFYNLSSSEEEIYNSIYYNPLGKEDFSHEIKQILTQKAKELFQNAKDIPIADRMKALYNLKISFHFNPDIHKELEDVIRQLIEQDDFDTVQDLIYTHNLNLDENFGKNEKFSYDEFLEQRFLLAKKFVHLEKNITHYKDEKTRESFVGETSALKKTKKAFEAYQQKETETKTLKRRIFTLLDLPDDTSPEILGEHIFLEHTNTSPQGRVKVTTQEAYFLISFSKKEDYLKFSSGLENSGGTYHRSLIISLGESITITALLIASDEETAYYPQIVTHERQHFINDVINLEELEKKYGINKWAVQKYGLEKILKKNRETYKKKYDHRNESLRSLKDEWLAYIRDGGDPKDISSILCENPLYSHCYNYLTPEEVEKIKKLLQDIAEKIKSTNILQKISREIFVYMFIDVPLPSWPKLIGAFTKTYGDKKIKQTIQNKVKKQRKFLEDEFDEGRFGKNNKKSTGG